MSGFIKIHRKILEWEWYKKPITKAVFLHLLLRANREDKTWKGVLVKRGECITSLSKLASELGISVQQARDSLNNMQKTHEVTIKTTNRYSLIKLNNYDSYQLNDKQSTHETTSKTHTVQQQLKNKEIIKEKIYKKENLEKVEKPENVSLTVWNDFVQHRKFKKAPVTTTALENIQREARKAGWTLEQALTEICGRGWQGFKAEWVNKDSPKKAVAIQDWREVLN